MQLSDNEKNNLQTRLLNLRKELKLNQENFGKPLGYGQSLVSEIEKGNKDATERYLKLISNYYNINLEWLKAGKGDKYIQTNATAVGDSYTIDQIDESLTKFVDIGDGQMIMITPLVQEYAYAGYLSGFRDPEYINELPKHTITVSKLHQGNYQSFEVVGDSMTTTEPDLIKDNIYDGDIVTGREIQRQHWRYKLHTHRFPDYIFVHKRDGILVKRVKSHNSENGEVILESLNPNKEIYPDFEINLEDVHQVFSIVRVTQHRRI